MYKVKIFLLKICKDLIQVIGVVKAQLLIKEVIINLD